MNVLVGISTKDRFGYLQKTIPHNQRIAGFDADWIVIDDGSSDPRVWRWIENEEVEGIRNKRSKGISGTKNQLFDLAISGQYDVLVCIDDDIMLSFNWLFEFIDSYVMHSDFGILAPLVVNDKTMIKKLAPFLGKELDFEAIAVDGLGAACTVIDYEVFSTWRYDEDKKLYDYEDAAFHSKVIRGGYKLGVIPYITAFHLQDIVWIDPSAEKEKLRRRHLAKNLPESTLDRSFKRLSSGVLNQYILESV